MLTHHTQFRMGIVLGFTLEMLPDLATAINCPARNKRSPCQSPGYCYPSVCRHRQEALDTVNQETSNAEPQAAPEQLSFSL